MSEPIKKEKELLDANVNSVVKDAALRRISVLVQETRETDANSAILTKRLLRGLALTTLVVVALILCFPTLAPATLRLLTAISR